MTALCRTLAPPDNGLFSTTAEIAPAIQIAEQLSQAADENYPKMSLN